MTAAIYLIITTQSANRISSIFVTFSAVRDVDGRPSRCSSSADVLPNFSSLAKRVKSTSKEKKILDKMIELEKNDYHYFWISRSRKVNRVKLYALNSF